MSLLFSNGKAGTVLAIVSGLAITACEPAPEETLTEIVGDVHFEVSCDRAVQNDFNRAVATLHSFEFVQARGQFEAVAAADPACAMAWWGVAMTHYHPLWAQPIPPELAAGAAAVARAESLPSTARESLYIAAIGSIYAETESKTHRERAREYEAGMAALRQAFPDDDEATIFSAVAMLSNMDPRDKTYAVRKSTGAMLEPMFAEMPNHPGLAHYIIHSYDVPVLAAGAEEAAHRYLKIAPSMPHALHMSGHIFTQLAMWEASIKANTLSAAVARERLAKGTGPQASEMHALDYLVYALIQTDDLNAAKEIVDYIDAKSQFDWVDSVVSFNAGAIPVRWAMERKAWDEAAALPPLTGATIYVSYEHKNAVAIRHWARAIGAAHLGDADSAAMELATLAEIAAALSEVPDVWARNTSETLRLQAEGWIAHAQGDNEKAVELLSAAAAIEDQTDKSGLSPGRVLPAREQLADLLMALDQPGDALMEYEKSLQQAPLRVNSVEGAARARAAMDAASG